MAEVQVWLTALDAGPDEAGRLLSLLSPDERERASRLRLPGQATRFVAARARLRLLLATYLGRPAAALQFCYGHRGKPAVVDGGGLEFNVSHSADLALFGFSRGRSLGVDIERVRPEVRVAALARRFFAAEESEAILNLPAAAQSGGFFSCWARKEAILKALGEGLAVPLSSFAVTCAPGDAPRIMRPPEGHPGVAGWRLVGLDPCPGFAAAVCAEGADWSLRCRRWDTTPP